MNGNSNIIVWKKKSHLSSLNSHLFMGRSLYVVAPVLLLVILLKEVRVVNFRN